MTTEEALRQVLVFSESVTALVGTRVYPQILPQGANATAGLPAVVITVISDVPERTFTSEPGSRLSDIRAQVDVWAATYLQAHQVAAKVDAVLSALAGVDLSADRVMQADDYEDETQLHRVRMDYQVWRAS